MAQTGAFAPFSDSFRYGNNGFLVVGESDSGKTAVTGRFVRYNGGSKDRSKWCTRWGRDSSTNYFEDENMYLYPNRKQLLADFEPILKGGERVVLNAIFYLLSEDEPVCDADVRKALESMFLNDTQHTPKDVIDITYEAYKHVPVITVPRHKTPDEKYRTMKSHVLRQIGMSVS